MSVNDPILVAVDGSECSTGALRYAAAEARRVGGELRILHVAPEFPPVVGPCPTPLVASAEIEAAGARIVAEARDAAAELVGTDRVTAQLATGDRVATILERAPRARIVVLGVGCASLLEHRIVGSTLSHVAGRSAVPVVAVPADWAPQTPIGPIVVALKRYDATTPALIEAALDRAAAEHAGVHLVHVWDVPPAYADVVGAATDLEGWAQDVDRRIRADMSAALARHAGVEVQVHARYGQPATVLQELSARASLLVIVRPAHALSVGPHLGSTARALLRDSRCPVEVVPAPATSHRVTRIDRSGGAETVPSGLTRRVEDLIAEGTAP